MKTINTRLDVLLARVNDDIESVKREAKNLAAKATAEIADAMDCLDKDLHTRTSIGGESVVDSAAKELQRELTRLERLYEKRNELAWLLYGPAARAFDEWLDKKCAGCDHTAEQHPAVDTACSRCDCKAFEGSEVSR